VIEELGEEGYVEALGEHRRLLRAAFAARGGWRSIRKATPSFTTSSAARKRSTATGAIARSSERESVESESSASASVCVTVCGVRVVAVGIGRRVERLVVVQGQDLVVCDGVREHPSSRIVQRPLREL
jgi:hypothetical protein